MRRFKVLEHPPCARKRVQLQLIAAVEKCLPSTSARDANPGSSVYAIIDITELLGKLSELSDFWISGAGNALPFAASVLFASVFPIDAASGVFYRTK
jgi:hypothetical protein